MHKIYINVFSVNSVFPLLIKCGFINNNISIRTKQANQNSFTVGLNLTLIGIL